MSMFPNLTDVNELPDDIEDKDIDTGVENLEDTNNPNAGVIGNNKQIVPHQYKILINDDKTKTIEIYLYGDMEYHVMSNEFSKLIALIESLSDKDTLILHIGSSYLPMNTQSAMAYLSAVDACNAKVITCSNNITNVYDLALLLCGTQVKTSPYGRCMFKDLAMFKGGTEVDADANSYFANIHKEQIKEFIFEKEFMTSGEWDATIGKNKYFKSIGQDFQDRLSKGVK